VKDDPEEICPKGLVRVPDNRRDLILFNDWQKKMSVRRIPKIVHLTARSRCMPPIFSHNIDHWRFEHYTVLVHDDESVERLMGQFFPEFPELQKAAHCLLSGAGKADLWRALVLVSCS
jgi:mannosyltransferase OCH1-like enzyme